MTISQTSFRTMTQAEALDRIRSDLVRARPDVVGIIAFGSFARGEDWRDVDVLVVLPTLRSDPAGWAETAHALRQAVDLPRVEVIPYSQPGFINGLREHSPFLLDVALDGIVLHDRANLAEAIAGVKRDLHERGIYRLRPGSWRFPVQHRRSTPLSERRNEEYVRLWLGDADRDAQAAAALRLAGLHDRSVYHCQQAVGRAVKACLACFGAFERTHFVARELRLAINDQSLGEWADRLRHVALVAERLEPHVARARYVIEDAEGEKWWVPADQYSDSNSATALNETREAIRIVHDFVDWWFAPER